MSTEQLSENLERIHKRIEVAGGDVANTTIVAVTKYHSIEDALAAYQIGITNFGENYLDGLIEKHEALPEATWHYLGTVQRNKLTKITENADVIQSIDRTEVLDAIARREQQSQLYIEIDMTNISGRPGCAPEDAPGLVERARGLDLEITGLMTVGTPGEPEDSRPIFRRLAQLARDLEVSELSMGMSADLEIAIEEGATMVRVGTALFGRPHATRQGE